MTRSKGRKRGLTLAAVCGLVGVFGSAHAQAFTAEQMKGLLPDEKFLKGFTRLMPSREIYLPDDYSQKEKKWVHPVSPSTLLQDQVSLKPGHGNNLDEEVSSKARISRQLCSLDGRYEMSMTADVFASVADAEKAITNFRRACSSIFQFGRPSDPLKFDTKTYSFDGRPGGATPFGNESYYNVNRPSILLLRTGVTVILLDGHRSYQAGGLGSLFSFPSPVTEGIAYEIVRRAAPVPANGVPTVPSVMLQPLNIPVPPALLTRLHRIYVGMPGDKIAKLLPKGWEEHHPGVNQNLYLVPGPADFQKQYPGCCVGLLVSLGHFNPGTELLHYRKKGDKRVYKQTPEEYKASLITRIDGLYVTLYTADTFGPINIY